MKEFKGTQGPWLTDGRTLYSLQDSDSRFVDKENRFSAGFFGYKNCPEDEVLANVKLCAAAPELLEALHNMVEAYQYEASVDNPALLAARATIAKALGETK